MSQLHFLYTLLDLAGTFAFAISGATAAKQRGLDLFGIGAIAFTVACGGVYASALFLRPARQIGIIWRWPLSHRP